MGLQQEPRMPDSPRSPRDADHDDGATATQIYSSVHNSRSVSHALVADLVLSTIRRLTPPIFPFASAHWELQSNGSKQLTLTLVAM